MQLKAALAPFAKRKVLIFDDIRTAFKGFADPADAEKCAAHICAACL